MSDSERLESPSDTERIKNFVVSASADVILFDPRVHDEDFSTGSPELPQNATYDKKSVRWVVHAGHPLHIRVNFYGCKAQSVFLSMVNERQCIQIYKPQEGFPAQYHQMPPHYADPLPYDQEYVLTTASKDFSSREDLQPWWNNHPLGRPLTDGFGKKSEWKTDDSRDPGTIANVTVIWYHDGYVPNFTYIE
jgi:hypothetical protein